MPPRRRYDQYCSAARALDLVGDRWTLLIVRELLAGPRRYTDLHADLPGVSTDVLASRLKDMERDGLAGRRRLPPPGAAYVYELTPRGRDLLPVLHALGEWGSPELAEPGPTDAVRAHWSALPLLAVLNEAAMGAGVVEVHLDEGDFHLYVGAEDGPAYGHGPAPGGADARLVMDAAACAEVCRGGIGIADAVRAGRVTVTGDGALAKALRAD
ncbi:helix-turn-helix domain-containing protein [Streptomyces sp. SID4982]|uniref:winged helix-turn-helix transcriptional regulator n=1 Tax=Streptomyces sp. SID4982 TaxID=2690291 RepID=UPI00136B257F|nr:helix-turn-helix domain-containing protein [Streptomyces sp. SID4982]MYS15272.1 transcriptional regulator [Streptomyces sp. SID4982]